MEQELANGFYQVAKDDFVISKILYNTKEYPNAIYHLQQAVEKLSKAFGLLNGFIDVDTFEKKISHNSEKIFKNPIRKHQEELKESIELEKLFPDFYKYEIDGNSMDLTGESRKIYTATQKMIHLDPKKYKWAPINVIDKMLDAVQALNIQNHLSIEEVKSKFPSLYSSSLSQLEKKTGKKLQEVLPSLEELDEYSSLIHEVFFQKMPLFLYTYNSLFFLSLLTSMHNQSTRYPCKCCGDLPKNQYNLETPIVIKFKRLINCFSKALDCYEALHVKEK